MDKGYVIAGSPATVRERLIEEVIKRLHVGNLMVLVQIGSMPHELTKKNIDLFAREVLPVTARDLGRQGLGEPLVARAPARQRASAGGAPRGSGDGASTADGDGLAGAGAVSGPRRRARALR